jgi:diguanylate cyclase (GGDEF)-like protein
MESSSTLSILILGFLVLVFGSILRKRTTEQMQLWFLGWVLLLINLLAVLLFPRIGIADRITSSVSGSATILTGVSFLLAVSSAWGKPENRKYVVAAVAAPALIYTNAVCWHVTTKPLLLAVIAGGLAANAWVLWRLYGRFNRQMICASSACVAVAGFIARDVAGGDFASGTYSMQAALFLFSGALFHRRFVRWSIGTITATVGLMAWGGSLLGIGAYTYGLSDALVQGAAWNAPVYVVALGMILTVLEEQIRDAAEAGKRLAHQAHHDALTGLPNRVLLDDRLSHALARATRCNGKAAVLCIYLDRFKQVNDTFGHYVGDLYLKEVVARLSSRVRSTDTLARTGGDEFTAVIGDFSSPNIPAKVAESLLDTLREPLIIQDCPFPATACIGIANFS